VSAIALIGGARTLVRHWSRRLFFTFEARGDGSLRSQGRPAERLCEATTHITRAKLVICDSCRKRGEGDHHLLELQVGKSPDNRARIKNLVLVVRPELRIFSFNRLLPTRPTAHFAAPKYAGSSLVCS